MFTFITILHVAEIISKLKLYKIFAYDYNEFRKQWYACLMPTAVYCKLLQVFTVP